MSVHDVLYPFRLEKLQNRLSVEKLLNTPFLSCDNCAKGQGLAVHIIRKSLAAAI